uniref:Tripartite motif containing 77 n=1 Tax=Canis lupus familiaris TaxID=9615 RepID=A0A8C0NAX6_CANLF
MDSNINQDELFCSICVNYFIDPVTIGCGHSFCRPCLCIFWEEAPYPPYCPVCRETSHQMKFKTNIVLKTRLFLARRARPYRLPSSAEQMCEIHMKTKNFFCEVIKDLLCLLCCKSKEHVAHKHCSIGWTAEGYRQNLLKQMRSLWEQTQENRRNQKRETSKVRTWEVSKGFCFLHEAVQQHLPQPVDAQLSSWPITGLIERLSQFLGHVHHESTSYANVNLRHLHVSPNHPDVVTNTKRSNYFLAWGAQTFTCGQHYWEVDVGNCQNWVLGFCDDSWTMTNDMVLDSEGIFLLFCIKEDNQCSLFTSSPPSPQYVQRPLGQVGVFLDYERGVVSFVHVASSSLICSFLSCSFSCPLRPFLCSASS